MDFSKAFPSSAKNSKRRKKIEKLSREINQNLSDLETIFAKTQAAKQAVAALKQETEEAKRKQPCAKRQGIKQTLLRLLKRIGLPL